MEDKQRVLTPGIKGEMTGTVYVALLWNIIYWIMMIITIIMIIIMTMIMIIIIIVIIILITRYVDGTPTSPQSLPGTSAYPTMVTLVNIMVMNGWLTSFSFHVNRPSHSRDKAISDFDLEISTPGSRSWVWSKGKVIQSAQYHINSLRFHFTSIRPTIP